MNHFDANSASMAMFCDAPGCTACEVWFGSYQECIDEAKDNDWQIARSGDEWFHYCSDHNPYQRQKPTEMFKD